MWDSPTGRQAKALQPLFPTINKIGEYNTVEGVLLCQGKRLMRNFLKK